MDETGNVSKAAGEKGQRLTCSLRCLYTIPLLVQTAKDRVLGVPKPPRILQTVAEFLLSCGNKKLSRCHRHSITEPLKPRDAADDLLNGVWTGL